MSYYLVYSLLVLHFVSGIISGEVRIKREGLAEDEEEPFVPTHEWQVVKKGQAIPKGLHVRLNLQTGKTEAKLLDPTEEVPKNGALVEVPNENRADESSNQISPEELKQLLKNIKADDEAAEVENIEKSFKSYEQIKAELGDLNLSVKSDAEILRELLDEFKAISSNVKLKSEEKNEKLVKVLQNFEYLVHQIDNANEFINLDGFAQVVYKSLNGTSAKVKCECLSILGSCVQNNAKAQIHAFETGAVDKLLKVLALDADEDVRTRTLYALSNLLRRFPIAQREFVKNGGLSVFISTFVKSDNLKLHTKIITLLYDLLMEWKDAHDHPEHPDYKEKVRQYDLVDLKMRLNQLDFCSIFKLFVLNNLLVENNDHDFAERCLNVFSLLTDTCSTYFQDEKLRLLLNELYKTYETLSEQEKQENSSYCSYFEQLRSLVFNLRESIFQKSNRDEL